MNYFYILPINGYLLSIKITFKKKIFFYYIYLFSFTFESLIFVTN